MSSEMLPTELWLQIFENLDYIALKNCVRVCKKFQALVGNAVLDTKLYRSSGTSPADSASLVTKRDQCFHPALHNIAVKPHEVQITGRSRPYLMPIPSIASEFATLNGATEVLLRGPVYGRAENVRGVTVQDIVNAMKPKIRIHRHSGYISYRNLGPITLYSASCTEWDPTSDTAILCYTYPQHFVASDDDDDNYDNDDDDDDDDDDTDDDNSYGYNNYSGDFDGPDDSDDEGRAWEAHINS